MLFEIVFFRHNLECKVQNAVSKSCGFTFADQESNIPDLQMPRLIFKEFLCCVLVLQMQ